MKLRMRLLSLLLAGALAFTSVDMSVYAASVEEPVQENAETRSTDDNGNQTSDGQPEEGEPEEGEPATEEGEATEENAEAEAEADAEAEPTEVEPTEEEPIEEELVEEELTEEDLLTEEEEEEEEEQIISYNEITPIHTKYKLALVSLEKKFPKYIYAMTNKDEEVKIRIYDWVAVDDYDQNLGEYKFEPVIDTDYQVSEDAEEPALMVYVEDESDGPTGYVADETKPDVPVVKNESGLLKAALPDTYNNKDNLPVIRDQGQEGACWAFATMAAIESDLISKGEASKSIDLSELQMAYFAAHNFDDPKNCHDNDTFSFAGAPGKKYLSTGGNTTISTRALMNKIGAVKEDYAPYSMGADAVLDDIFAVSSDYVQLYDSYEINYENKDLIKEAIMQRGAVAASFWASEDDGFGHTVITHDSEGKVVEKEYRGDAHYSATYNSFYGSYENTNHAIALVGWDDNFSKDNFYEGCKPEGNGAWLVRNSWGLDDYGKQGYFWLSYYDAGLKSSGSVTAFSASTTQYDNAYSYATGESVSYYTLGSYNDGDPITIEVKYSVDAGETIEAVSTEILNTNSKIDVSVTDGKNTVSGSRNVVEAGNYTVKLTSGLEITEKTDVTVTVTITPAANEKPLLLFEDTDPNEIGNPNPNSKDYCVTTHTASMDKGFSVKRGSSTKNYSKDPLVRIYTNDVTTGDVSGELSVSEDEILDYGGTTHTVTMADDSIIKDASKLTWSVVDNTIATVSAAGVITLGHKRGSTIVVGSYVDPTTNKKYEVNIRVTIKHYEIIYDGDGITVADKYKEYYPGDVASCTLPTSTQIRKLGYKLEGLYLDAEFTTELTSEILSTKTGTVTVYPKWEKQKVALMYVKPNSTLDGYLNNNYTIIKSNLYMDSFPYTLPTRSDLGYYDDLIQMEGSTGKVFSYFSWDEAGEQPVNVITLDDAFAADNDLNSVYGLIVTLYPQYKDDTSVKVTFNPNGGSVNKSSQSVEPGEAYGTLPTPTRTGYTFTGWHLNTASGAKVDSTTIVNTNSAHTLVASWEANKYTITFYANGGTVDVATKEVTYDSLIGELPVPTRYGYNFKGWFTKSLGGIEYKATSRYDFTSNLSLYAQWTEKSKVKINYNVNSGDSLKPSYKEVYNDEPYGTLPTPTRTGYTFTGWHYNSADGDIVTAETALKSKSAHTIYASWEANKYTITFNANGGTVDVDSKEVTYDSLIGELPVPTRDEYVFDGWFTSAYSDTEYKATSKCDFTTNKTLYAHWTEINKVKITFNANGGDVTPSYKTVNEDDAYGDLPTPTRAGYEFVEWRYDSATGAKVTEETPLKSTSNHTLVAFWKANTYNVTFDSNGGSVTTTTKSFTSGSGIYDLPTPTKEGYIFDGWYTEESGGTEVKAGDKYTYAKDITLYAHWLEKPAVEVKVTVYIRDYRARVLDTREIKQGEPYGTLPEIPERSGYRPVGWYSSSKQALISETDIVGMYTEDYVTPRYEAIEYTAHVIFDSNGGSAVEPKTYKWTYDSVPQFGELEIPTKENAEFLGWSTVPTVEIFIVKDTDEILLKNSYDASQLESDITLYAIWQDDEPERVHVLYHANGGTLSYGYERETIGENLVVGSKYYLYTPYRQGYEFVAWHINTVDGPIVTESSIVELTEDHTIIAEWQPAYVDPNVRYRILLNPISDYGTVPADLGEEEHVTGEKIGKLPALTSDEKVFAGWYWDSLYTDRITEESIIPNIAVRTMNIYAKWIDNPKVATITASVEPGDVELGTVVTLETETNYATIVYTINGGSQQTYSDGIILDQTGTYTIKAKATASGYTDSDEATFTYTVKDSDKESSRIENAADRAEYEASPKTGIWIAGIHNNTFTYNGAAFKLTPDADFRVYDGVELLQNKVDYTYKLAKNTNAGQATISIIGKGDYKGTYTDTFTIEPKPFDEGTTYILAKDAYPYTGKLIKSAVTVKDVRNGKTVTLSKNKDYTLEYFDAANGQATSNTMTENAGQKAVKVVGKGNYVGEHILIYYVADKTKCLSNASVTVDSKDVVIGQGTDDQAGKIKLTVKLNGNKIEDAALAKCTITYKYVDIPDSVDYGNRSKIVTGGNYMVTITGDNQELVGSVTKKFAVKGGTALSKKMISGFVSKVPYTTTAYTQQYVAAGLTEGVDYILVRDASVNIGKHTDIFYGIGKYKGKLTYQYSIAGTPINKNVTVTVTNKNTGKDFFEYKGEPYTLEDLAVKVVVDGKEVTADNYDVQLPKDTLNAGNKNIVIVGKNLYTGKYTKSKAFAISTVNLDDSTNRARIKVSMDEQVKYIKGGTKKLPTITFDNKQLDPSVVKTCFNISYSNNTGTIAKNADDKVKVTIKPKKNFVGKQAFDPIYYSIGQKNLEDVTVSAADKVYNVNSSKVKSAPVLNDMDDNGKLKKLVAGTDYEKNIYYEYVNIKDPITKKQGNTYVDAGRAVGDPVDKYDVIPVGTIIQGTVKGKGAYTGDITFTYRIISANVSSASVSIAKDSNLKNGLDYTGKARYIKKSDLVVKFGKNTLTANDYDIVNYQNNVKKGKATITIKGKGNYGGTKKYTFNINPKTITVKAN
ncbi:Listeria/Bacterioides repeat-containing protein [Pseudobutyrivibrio sp. OR37]|uniref:InlB B-repeat-containing protein n=1 Tax=Pseudobutyrivibrio sp. OR37 TaxID=1798186 RepID=UPI0008F17D3F|nr:InlB B-repeat-containing protein [Pseudobutyrivibrio sp. OR37]SFH99059.1 Listeria/Bacterioides repeat-containing protein [Pseudobutyrivibrio sp. OR37]